MAGKRKKEPPRHAPNSLYVLVNPKKPDQLITTINANIRKVYDCDEKTNEVIRLLYQTPSSPQD